MKAQEKLDLARGVAAAEGIHEEEAIKAYLESVLTDETGQTDTEDNNEKKDTDNKDKLVLFTLSSFYLDSQLHSGAVDWAAMSVLPGVTNTPAREAVRMILPQLFTCIMH